MKRTIIAVVLILGLFAAPVTAAYAQVSAPPEQFIPGGPDHRRDKASVPAKPGPDAGRTESTLNPVHKASDIIGKTVRGAQGESLGMVEDVMVGNDGRVHYVVLSRSADLGMGERMIPVPWRLVTFDHREGVFFANLNRTMLDEAPSFSSADWPDLSTPDWQKNIFSYYENRMHATGTAVESRKPGPDEDASGSNPAAQTSGPSTGGPGSMSAGGSDSER